MVTHGTRIIIMRIKNLFTMLVSLDQFLPFKDCHFHFNNAN